MDLDEFMAQSNARARRGRRVARATVVLALFSLVEFAFLAIAAPNGSQAMYNGPDYRLAITAVAFVGLIVGNVWILRIARRDPEAGQSFWRYRRR